MAHCDSSQISVMVVLLWTISSILFVPIASALSNEFLAAAYEHRGVSVNATSRKEALVAMMQNLDVLSDQAARAKQQGAAVVVFPEYGVTGDTMDPRALANPRQVLYPYMEQVPDVQQSPACSLCAALQPGTEAQQRLACMAQKNQIYLVANMIESIPCNTTKDSRCPSDNHFQYNTNLIFDPKGCLIAKYHKYNLYDDETLTCDQTDSPEHVFFDTEYGRFGTMICFDSVFKEPGVTLVEKYNVNHILLPTFWNNLFEVTLFRSVQWFSGWARRMGVNFIAADYHSLPDYSEGSVLASPNNIVNFTFDAVTDSGHLLTGLMRVENVSHHHQNNHRYYHSPEPKMKAVNVTIYNDIFNGTFLSGLSGSVSVCWNYLCCELDYTRNSTSETYVLAAFAGYPLFGFLPYYVEVCLLYRCAGTYMGSCNQVVTNSTTAFSNINLRATTFQTDYVFPSVLPSGFEYMKMNYDFKHDGFNNQISGDSSWPLVSAALVGRTYDKDRLEGPMTRTGRKFDSKRAISDFV